MLPSNFLFIADLDEAGDDFFFTLEEALKGGCRWVLLRGVKQKREAMLIAGRRVKNLCATYDAKFFVSRDPILARSLKADGLHMPAKSRFRKIPGQMLGQSCHNAGELKRAVANGAD